MTTEKTAAPRKALHISLWVVQVLLALALGMAGFGKATGEVAELSKNMAYAADIPLALLRFIGVAELFGALGLLLPAATRIKPFLTPLAAAGLGLIQLFAIPFHIARGEGAFTPANAVLGLLAAFVAWGRFKKAPIAPR